MGVNEKRGLAHPSIAKVLVIEGTHAASHAVRLSRVQVIAAYPITPQTGVVEKLSENRQPRRVKRKIHKS